MGTKGAALAIFRSHTQLVDPALTLWNTGRCFAREQGMMLRRYRDSRSHLAFFQRTLQLIGDIEGGGESCEARTCSICMDDDVPMRRLIITTCAHIFCRDCMSTLQQREQQRLSCPLCRGKLRASDCMPVALEVAAASPAPSAAPASALPEAKYGTKLAAILAKLQEIQATGDNAKVLVFTQWEALRRKIRSAFIEFNVPFLELKGTSSQRDHLIQLFQSETDKRFVMLMSLENSASGTNLTRASHVIFVHPMSAESRETALAFEAQAIGRCCRIGQRADVVHVWRFVALGTVEEQITRQHQDKALLHSSQLVAT